MPILGLLIAAAVLTQPEEVRNRAFEIPGFAHVRVTAAGRSPTIAVRADSAGVTYAEVGGGDVTRSELEFTDIAPTGLYFGNGWHVTAPGDFNFWPNGHINSARYAGFDLEDGRSIVFATSLPPMAFYHDTAKRTAGYRCTGPTVFALFPGRDGAFAGAIRCRRFFDALGETASPGARAKAGQFCVDSWNGTFREHAELIRRAAAYGVTNDVFLLMHCWQRHGYDRHLPDVWPPHPGAGTPEEAKDVLACAAAHGWRCGVHLNTIDIYSNSTWFAWDRICHNDRGEPVKAWRNPYSGEQSYRLLHACAPASAEFQLAQMDADGFRPDTFFVDVSGGSLNYLETCCDRAGAVHPMTENLHANGRMFDILREAASRGRSRMAFISTESPCDALVGHLDGGDCQWMTLEHELSRIYCWAKIGGVGAVTKIPWFALVNHDRLALHGAGYSARYEAGRGELCHGIDSDDYISCEIMGGHAPMADCHNRNGRDAEELRYRPLELDRSLRQIVRKYWLEQPVARELAHARVTAARFADGVPTRVVVTWSTGMTVWVNRGASDWTVDGVTLPPYGYRAWNPQTGLESKIYRHASGRVVEESAWRLGTRHFRYASARGVEPVPKFTPVEPVSQIVREGETVRVKTAWRSLSGGCVPAGQWQITYWIADPMFKESSPSSIMRQVATVVSPLAGTTEASFEFPPDILMRTSLLLSVTPLGADVENTVERLSLLGTAAFYRRYTQGFLETDGRCTGYEAPDHYLWPRLLPPDGPVDFGWTKTADGVCLITEPSHPDIRLQLPR